MKEFINYLERKIEGCDSLGGMEREKAIYQSVLKDYRKQFAISAVVGQSEQLVCDCGDSNMTWYGNDNDKQFFCFNCKKQAN